MQGFPKLRKELFPVKEVLKALPPEFTNQQKQKGLGVGSPGSPLARRSKHEIKSAQRMTYRYYQTPILWAKCLLSTCFSLWFAHLPSFITVHAQKGRVLDLAFHILQRIQNQSLTHQDEVCYRVMMQLCGVYSKPVLAVKTLCEMRNAGIVPNAITYGYYNRALLESKWNPSNLLWNKLRNVMLGVSAFRQCGVERANRRKSLEEDIISNDADSASRVSIESVASCESNKVSQFKTDTLSSDPGYCSISENCEAVNISPSSTTTTSACNEGDLLSRSESNLSLSPVQENILSSGDTSYSSATATVTYDTAPSSPIIAPQSTHIPSSVVTSSTNLTPQSGPHSPCVVTSTPVSTPDTPLSPVVTSITSLLSPTSTTDTKSPIKNIDESVSSSSRNISSLYSPSGNKSSFYSGLFFNNFIPSNFKTNTTTPSSTATVTPNENKVILQSLSSNTSSHFNNLDFTHSDELRKKLGSIVRSSTAGLASGVQLSLIETHPLLVNSAGLLMTSPLDASYLSPERKPKPKPTDLAEALSSTLEKYDQIKEPSLILPNSFDSHSAEKGTVDYLRSYNYGKDEKIVKKLLNLVYPLDDPEVTVDKAKVTSDIIKKSESEKKRLDRNNKRQVSKTSKRQVDCVPPSGQSAQSSLYGVEKVLLEKKKVVHEFIDAEDDSDYGLETANSGVKQFFGRNTPERISSLWRRGVLGADVNLRGIWKKNPSRDNSKDEHQSSLGAGGAKNTKERRTSKKNLIKQLDKTSQEIKQSDTMSSEELKVECFISLDESTGVNPSVAPVLEKTVVEGRQVVLAGDPLGALNKQLFESPGGLPRDLKETSHGNFLDVNKSLPELRGPLLQINKSTQKSRTLDDSSRILNKPPKHPNKLVSTSLTKNIMYDPLGVFDDPNDDPFIPETQTPTHYSSMSKLNRNDPINSPENDFKSRSSTNLFSTPFSGEEFAPSANRVPGIVSNQQPDTLLPVTPFKLSGTSTLGLASSVATHGLRQATKHIETLRTQYFDPAMTELVSQSNFSSRRNDLISGSLSSMRSAVSSLSKKYNSIREAISHTPVKNSWRNDEGYIDSPDGFWMRRESCESALSSSEDTFNNFPLSKDDDQNTEVDRSLPNSWLQTGPFCLGIWITSCSKCHNCEAILYDEEIMSGWRPDDSNLNTRCWHCSKVTVPILTVSIYYLRHLPKPTNEKITTNKESSNVDSSNAERRKTAKQNKRSFNDETIAHIQDKGIPLEPLTVPYLSPLVLRKELETMLGHDGDSSLSLPSFPEQHPILYWNLLWYFSRLRLPSHLSSLCLSSLSSLKDRPVHDHWKEADWRHVYVRCLWDNIHYHQELGSPLYMQWKENYSPSTLLQALTPLRAKVPKSVLESYLTLLHFNQVDRCLELMLQTLRKRPAELRYKHYPIYRDLFFFTLTALPRQELNIMRFEQEFRKEFDKVQPPNAKIINESDGPPPIPAVFCRKYFWDLSL